MEINSENTALFNTAINEAALYEIHFYEGRLQVSISIQMAVLSSGNNYDPEFLARITLENVSRISIIIKRDRNAKAPDTKEMSIEEIETLIRKKGGSALYGWNFLNPDERPKIFTQEWIWQGSGESKPNTLNIFQDGGDVCADHFIDIYIDFDRLNVASINQPSISEAEILKGGDNAWAEFYNGNDATTKMGRRPILDENGDVQRDGNSTRYPYQP